MGSYILLITKVAFGVRWNAITTPLSGSAKECYISWRNWKFGLLKCILLWKRTLIRWWP